MKKVGIFVLFLILGPIFSCMLSVLWYSGANTFWKPIDYFPLPVNKIIVMKSFGKEFWVETNENEIYKIAYPCSEKQSCWEKSNNIPSDLTDGNAVDYKTSNDKCENDSFVYPLLHKIKMCITAKVQAPEDAWIDSLALTTDGNLWIWNKPWGSSFADLPNIFLSVFFGLILGLLVATLIVNRKLARFKKEN